MILQVATGLSFTVILTRHGQVYTCGSNLHGQLGHGDTLERPIPRKVERFSSLGPVVQISAGVSHTMAVTEDGTLYSFGYGSNFCLGHGDPRDELQPQVVQAFKTNNIHVIHVSAGDEHSVALDSNGYVSFHILPLLTWFIFTVSVLYTSYVVMVSQLVHNINLG